MSLALYKFVYLLTYKIRLIWSKSVQYLSYIHRFYLLTNYFHTYIHTYTYIHT